MTSPELPELTLYARDGCHLCEQAEAKLSQYEFQYQVINIRGQTELESRFGQDIPVLAWGDQVLLKGVLTPQRLSALKLRLRQARRA